MKDHEVPFKLAIKDKDGFATILVRFHENYIPVKGKPLPLIKEESPDLDEVKRLNLTRWFLKDAPEIAEIVGNICGEGYASMLYWNGNEGAWKFYDICPFSTNGLDEDELDEDELDELYDKLEDKIDELEDVLYKPHVDHTGNMGDDSVHCVYLGNSDVELWNDDAKPILTKHTKHIVTAVDTSDTSDGKARVLKVCNTREEAKAYVRADIEKWADDRAGERVTIHFDKMSAFHNDREESCEWNIEEVEIPQ